MTNAEARFNKSRIRKVHACLAVTCHLHFWQNDRDFLRATAVTRGWNGYRNKSQHRKSTLEKKILPPFQQGFEPATFQSRVRRSNHWAIPAPMSFVNTFDFYTVMGLHHKTYLGRTSRGVGMGLETSQQSTNITLVFQHQSVAQQCLAFAHKAELWPTK